MKREILVLLIILNLAFISSAQMHYAEDISVYIEGHYVSLQDAIDNNYFSPYENPSASTIDSGYHNTESILAKSMQGHTMTLSEMVSNMAFEQSTKDHTTSTKTGHTAEEILVYIDGDYKTLQYIIDIGRAVEYCSPNIGEPCSLPCYESGVRGCDGSCQVSTPLSVGTSCSNQEGGTGICTRNYYQGEFLYTCSSCTQEIFKACGNSPIELHTSTSSIPWMSPQFNSGSTTIYYYIGDEREKFENDDLYWYDSCGNKGAKVENCGNSYYGSWSNLRSCSVGTSIKNSRRERSVYRRGCLVNSPNAYYDDERCYSTYLGKQYESCNCGFWSSSWSCSYDYGPVL